MARRPGSVGRQPGEEERMADQVRETVTGDGYAVGTLDGMGEGPGFRKVRRELGVEAFGVNALILPEGYAAGPHYHDEQEELYFVHQGEMEINFGDGSSHRLGPGGFARVAPATVRQVGNAGQGELVYLAIGAKDGYVGRDGRVPGGEEITRPGG
jgi:mannose-6-phosphate isomerase-like protein (cupin superfamily)